MEPTYTSFCRCKTNPYPVPFTDSLHTKPTEGRLSEKHAIWILEKASEILAQEPNLLILPSPIIGVSCLRNTHAQRVKARHERLDITTSLKSSYSVWRYTWSILRSVTTNWWQWRSCHNSIPVFRRLCRPRILFNRGLFLFVFSWGHVWVEVLWWLNYQARFSACYICTRVKYHTQIPSSCCEETMNVDDWLTTLPSNKNVRHYSIYIQPSISCIRELTGAQTSPIQILWNLLWKSSYVILCPPVSSNHE